MMPCHRLHVGGDLDVILCISPNEIKDAAFWTAQESLF